MPSTGRHREEQSAQGRQHRAVTEAAIPLAGLSLRLRQAEGVHPVPAEEVGGADVDGPVHDGGL